jgi:hypothetical protein
MISVMQQGSALIKYLNPWKFRREERARRVAELRRLSGENCSRCRRPIRFDLPDGHDLSPRIEPVLHAANGGAEELGNACLTHGRCNPVGADHTVEAKERIRRKNEAELFSRSKKRA